MVYLLLFFKLYLQIGFENIKNIVFFKNCFYYLNLIFVIFFISFRKKKELNVFYAFSLFFKKKKNCFQKG